MKRYVLLVGGTGARLADALLAAGLVEEEVGGDAVQPAVEGSGLEVGKGAEDADKNFLGEVLGVVLVAG